MYAIYKGNDGILQIGHYVYDLTKLLKQKIEDCGLNVINNNPTKPILHKEDLKYEEIEIKTRSYK